MIATIARTKRKVMPKPQLRYIVDDADDDADDLKIAMERHATAEFISGEEFDVFLNNLINETKNREKVL